MSDTKEEEQRKALEAWSAGEILDGFTSRRPTENKTTEQIMAAWEQSAGPLSECEQSQLEAERQRRASKPVYDSVLEEQVREAHEQSLDKPSKAPHADAHMTAENWEIPAND